VMLCRVISGTEAIRLSLIMLVALRNRELPSRGRKAGRISAPPNTA
jgi:hypothetical protein